MIPTHFHKKHLSSLAGLFFLLSLNACTGLDESVYLSYDDEPEEACLTVFGEEEESTPRHADEDFSRARMAFLFGKYQFSYGIWKELAQAGHPDSQASLGWMYQTGKGVKKNRAISLKWYRKAAAQNHPIAQNNLGVLYEQGWGVKKNPKFAVRWYRESAEWGYSYGQHNLGVALYYGRGIKKNKQEGIFWLDLAAMQGVKEADVLLSKLIKNRKPAHHQAKGKSATKAKDPDAPVALRKRSWIVAKNPRHYTIQLMSAQKEQSVFQFVFHNRLTGRLAYAQMPPKGNKAGLYTLIFGDFASFEEAKTALGNLPESVQNSKPLVRRFAKIQDMLLGKKQTKKQTVSKSKKPASGKPSATTSGDKKEAGKKPAPQK